MTPQCQPLPSASLKTIVLCLYVFILVGLVCVCVCVLKRCEGEGELCINSVERTAGINNVYARDFVWFCLCICMCMCMCIRVHVCVYKYIPAYTLVCCFISEIKTLSTKKIQSFHSVINFHHSLYEIIQCALHLHCITPYRLSSLYVTVAILYNRISFI